MTPRFVHVGKDAKGAAGFLLAALPALGGVLTALAITGDLVGRMARDHPRISTGAFGCAAVSVFLGALAAFGLREGSSAERTVLHVGVAVLGIGLVLGVFGGVKTWGDRAQPSITIRPLRGAAVSVTVRDSGLRSSDHVIVEVEQLLRVSTARGEPDWRGGQPLYAASLGADGSGKVDHTVALPLPAGDFDDVGARAWVGAEPRACYATGNTTGCVRVHIPRTQEWPQLATTWETFVRAPRLLVRVEARNLPQRPPRTMTLRVFGLTSGLPPRTLAEWSLAADGDGLFTRRVAIVVGHAFSDVCVVASTTTREPQCPAPVQSGTVWAQLAVPQA